MPASSAVEQLESPGEVREPSPSLELLAWWGLAVLIVAAVLAAADRQILNLLAEPIRRSLDLSDTKLGLLQGGGIALFAGIAAVPTGWLADRYGRRLALAGCVLVWSAATAGCGLAWNFQSLFAAAVGLGIGEAGLGPIVYGLIPEMFSDRRRVLANGIFAVASIFGAGVGIGLSGALVQSLGSMRDSLPAAMHDMESWRLGFLAVAIPGPIVAVFIGFIRVRHANRSGAPTVLGEPSALKRYLARHGRTLFGIFGGTGLGGLGIAALAAWTPVIAARLFQGTPAQVGQGMGIAYLAGTGVGALIGGIAMKLMRPRLGVATPVRVLVLGLGLSAGAAAALFFATAAWHVYVLFGLQVAFLIAGSVVAPTMIQDMTPPLLRSRIVAIGSVATILLGAVSPVLVGLFSDALGDRPRALLVSVAVVASVSLAVGAALTKAFESAFVATVDAVRHDTIATEAASPEQHG